MTSERPPEEFLDEHGTTETFRAETDEGSSSGADLPPPRESMPGRKITILPFNEITLQRDQNYLVKGLVPREGLVVFWGPPKCGKSFLVFDMAMHVALGREYRGRRIMQGTVVYVACEGAAGFRTRVEAFRQQALDKETDVPFFLIPDNINLVADHYALVESVSTAVGGASVVAVVLDTLNRSIQGSESNDADMSAYIRAADAIRSTFRCAVVIIHHCGLDGTRPRGHTSLSGAVDAQIAVKKDDAGTIAATVELMKDGPDGDTWASRLEVVDLGADDDGDAITSCVVVPTDADAKPTAKLSPDQRRAIDVLRNCIVDQGEIIKGQRDIPTVPSVPLNAWREDLKRASVTDRDKPENERKQFRRHQISLSNKGLIRIWDERVWLTGQTGTCRDNDSNVPPQGSDRTGRTGTPP